MILKIDVLGVEYTVEKKSKMEDSFLESCDGYCDKTTHRIVVATKDDECTIGDFEGHQKKVMRHEVIHAFLFESGLAENWKHEPWGHDETFVDWVAIQFPKLLNAFKAADCL